jgi:hypothetical protein
MTLSARSRPRALDAGTAAPFRYSSLLRGWLTARWRRIVTYGALPAGLCARLAFERRERVLSADRDPDDGYALIATDRALYHRAVGDEWSRFGWEQITRVAWEEEGGRLVITGLAGVVLTRARVPLRERGSVPEIALERITHTRLCRWRIALPGDRHLLLEARRRPVTGELLWYVVSSGGRLDLSDSQLRAQVEQAIIRLGAESGITHQSAAVPCLWWPGGGP